MAYIQMLIGGEIYWVSPHLAKVGFKDTDNYTVHVFDVNGKKVIDTAPTKPSSFRPRPNPMSDGDPLL